tara:strand:+ start:102624 stop:102977 length:354 start_codon:yes stop_codon:yes gene_type:complete
MNYRNRKKGFTLVEIMIVVVIIGLLAAMAVPAFSKVRENSRNKAIENNLRQIASAGQQYMLENGKTKAKYTDLQADYFAGGKISKVAGEDYSGLTVKEAGGTLQVTTSGGDVVKYKY